MSTAARFAPGDTVTLKTDPRASHWTVLQPLPGGMVKIARSHNPAGTRSWIVDETRLTATAPKE